MSEAQRTAIVAAVLELPPMTYEQVDSVCEVIVAAQARRDGGSERDRSGNGEATVSRCSASSASRARRRPAAAATT